jgi:hypothetical protein
MSTGSSRLVLDHRAPSKTRSLRAAAGSGTTNSLLTPEGCVSRFTHQTIFFSQASPLHPMTAQSARRFQETTADAAGRPSARRHESPCAQSFERTTTDDLRPAPMTATALCPGRSEPGSPRPQLSQPAPIARSNSPPSPHPSFGPEVTKRSDLTHNRTNHELRPPYERYRARP